MRYLLTTLLIVQNLNSAGWTPPEYITQQSEDKADVYGAFNTSTEQMFAAWVTFDPGYPTYATYTEAGGWSAPQYITQNFQIVGDVVLAYRSAANEMFAAYTPQSSFLPTVSIFSNGSWGPPTVISTITAQNDVYLAYDPVNDVMYAGWVDTVFSEPNFAKYSGGVWSPIANIPFPAREDVSLVYDVNVNTLVVAFVDFLTGFPYFSGYNSGTNTWIGPLPINTANPVLNRIFVSNNIQASQLVFTWADITNTAYYIALPSMVSAAPIPGSIPVLSDVMNAYDPRTGNTFAAWISNTFPSPIYSILDPGTVTFNTAQVLSSAITGTKNVTLAPAPNFNSMFTFWHQTFPTWSQYISPPYPPTNLTAGKRRLNEFGTDSEFFVRIQWGASPTPPSGLLGYHIYLNGNLVKTVSSSTFSYTIHNLIAGVPSIITVSAFNAAGDSAPATVIVP